MDLRSQMTFDFDSSKEHCIEDIQSPQFHSGSKASNALPDESDKQAILR